MPAKAVVAYPGVVEAFVKVVVGLILAAVFIGVGLVAFVAIAIGPDKALGELSETPLGIVAAAVVIGISIVVAATMMSLKK